MGKSDDNPPKPAKKKVQTLDALHRMQLEEIAGELLGRGTTKRDVPRYLIEWAKEHGLEHLVSEGVARKIVEDFWKQVAAARWPDRENVAREIDHQLKTLARDAHEGKAYGAARQAIDSRARLHRLYTGETSGPEVTPADEFEQRSADDNAFYAEHGCWPEEYKKPTKKPAADPLAKLH